MERMDLESWFAGHPDAVRTEPTRLLDTCEREVRAHAQRDAWLHACEVAEESVRRFEHLFGLPASDAFVTREVCHEIARELKHHEPHPDELQCAEWVGRALIESVDRDARWMLRAWLKELGEREEHEAWLVVVDFADRLVRHLIRDTPSLNDLDWDPHRSYPRIASRVARLMIREFEARATREETMH